MPTKQDRPGAGFPGPQYQTEGWKPTKRAGAIDQRIRKARRDERERIAKRYEEMSAFWHYHGFDSAGHECVLIAEDIRAMDDA